MNLNDLKTAFTRERHAELMIASGGAILVAVMASILDPETLKIFDAPGLMPGLFAKVIVWAVVILGGAYLILKGLNRIDRERAIAISPQRDLSLTNNLSASNPPAPLAIQIRHGDTHISIHIQQEKNDAR